MAAATETRLIPVAFRLNNSVSCSTAMGKNYDLRLSPRDQHFSSLDEETIVVTSQKTEFRVIISKRFGICMYKHSNHFS